MLIHFTYVYDNVLPVTAVRYLTANISYFKVDSFLEKLTYCQDFGHKYNRTLVHNVPSDR